MALWSEVNSDTTIGNMSTFCEAEPVVGVS